MEKFQGVRQLTAKCRKLQNPVAHLVIHTKTEQWECHRAVARLYPLLEF